MIKTADVIKTATLIKVVKHEITEGHDFILDEKGLVTIAKAEDGSENFFDLPDHALQMGKAEAQQLRAWLNKLNAKGLL